MARAPLRSKRAPRRRRIARIPRVGLKSRLANSEFASMSQTLALPNDMMNIVYRLDDINLSQFDRAVQVARAYQYFRISKIELQFKPFMDTFTNGTGQSLPYLYYMLLKGDNIDAGTFNQLRDAGAKPIRFDDRTRKVVFKPRVLQGVIGEDSLLPGNPPLTAWSIAKTSPWLATSYLPASQALAWTPSTVPHKGLLYGVQEDFSTVTQYYEVSITAHFQFKKPLTLLVAGDTHSSTVKVVIDKEDVPPVSKEPPVLMVEG